MNEKMDDKQDDTSQYTVVTKNFKAVFGQKTNEGFNCQQGYYKGHDITNN